MHDLEFGIFALATIIEKELGDSDLAKIAFGLASYSHNFSGDIEGGGEVDDVIEELRTRSKPYLGG